MFEELVTDMYEWIAEAFEAGEIDEEEAIELAEEYYD